MSAIMQKTDSDFQPGGKPWTGRRVLITALIFFGVIIAVNMTMLYLALQNFSGLVVKNSYVASQDFNARNSAAAAAAITAWAVAVDAQATGLRIEIRDAEGAPVQGASLLAQIRRPTHARDDANVTLAEVAPGVYAADLPLKPGAWRLALQHDGVARGFDLFVTPTAAQ